MLMQGSETLRYTILQGKADLDIRAKRIRSHSIWTTIYYKPEKALIDIP